MENKKKILTFGELTLRLAPFHYETLTQASRFQVNYGGGEANVAVSLANFGHDAAFISRIPDNPIGDAAVNTLRKQGVNIDYILREGARLGIYFLEHGVSIRPSKVTYDRAASAISEAGPGSFDWSAIFKGKTWFHISGITPALSPNVAEISIDSVKAAKKEGLTVSCDLNYRHKLWTRDQAKEVMTELVKYVDIIIANEEDCANVFGIEFDKTNVESGKLNLDEAAHEKRPI